MIQRIHLLKLPILNGFLLRELGHRPFFPEELMSP